MWIKSILLEELSFANINGTSKKRVIDFIAEIFAEYFDNIDSAQLFKHLVNREKLGSTGIGAGVAIPHCRFPTDGRTLCMCITLEEPVDFDAVDRQPVDIIFAMVVPEGSEENHLERLAALANALQDKSYLSKLRAAKDSQELYHVAIQY